MKAAILYNEVPAQASNDDLDTLFQVKSISEVLMSHNNDEVLAIPVSLDLTICKEKLLDFNPDYVFNLVESLDNSDRLLPIGALLLEHLKIPFTGSSANALQITSNKIIAKQLFMLGGLPTPAWFTKKNLSPNINIKAGQELILKSETEHASVGLKHYIFNNINTLCSELKQLESDYKSQFFAEEYINGREFNLSMLQKNNEIIVLPPAEIIFKDFNDSVKIVDYNAKWNENTFSYKNTIRSFTFDNTDTQLLQNLKDTAIKCWQLFNLSGYARVDFRVDKNNSIYILEINSNPCLSPDGGYAAAALNAGIKYNELIEVISTQLEK